MDYIFNLFSRRFSRIVFEEIFDLLSQFNLRCYLSTSYIQFNYVYKSSPLESRHYDHNSESLSDGQAVLQMKRKEKMKVFDLF